MFKSNNSWSLRPIFVATAYRVPKLQYLRNHKDFSLVLDCLGAHSGVKYGTSNSASGYCNAAQSGSCLRPLYNVQSIISSQFLSHEVQCRYVKNKQTNKTRSKKEVLKVYVRLANCLEAISLDKMSRGLV